MKRLTQSGATTAALLGSASRRTFMSTADFDKFDKDFAAHSAATDSNPSEASSSSLVSSSSNSNDGSEKYVTVPMTVWTTHQHAYRNLLKSLRGAYYNDRAKLFWARHFVRVEFYKYGKFVGEGDIKYKREQEKMMREMLAKEAEEAAARDSAMDDLLGMGATTEEELAAQKEIIDGHDEKNKKTDSTAAENDDDDGTSSIPISTSMAVGTLNLATPIMYTYSQANSSPSPQHQHLVNIANECADFVDKYMKINIDRIVEHNEVMMTLSVADAKKFRQAYLLREEQHDSWCKQKIRQILDRRPLAPYPYC